MEHLSIPAIKFISSLQSFYEALAAENEINDIFIQNDGSIAVKIMGEVYWDLNRDGNQIFLS